MKQTYVGEIGSHEGEEVVLKGWLGGKRSGGGVRFLQLRDGTGLVQCVVSREEVRAGVFECVAELTLESSLAVTGTVRADRRAIGGYEISVRDLEIIQVAEPYPIAPKEHGVGFLMDHRHLWLRSVRQQAILRVRSEIAKACRDYYDEHGFMLIDAPIFTPSACEGTTTLFETDYFDDRAYLTQSGQLYMEAAAMAFGKVYCFGPTFRAERSKTRRHLTEFWMIEPEVAYAELGDMMELAEDFITYIVERVLARNENELTELGRDLEMLRKVRAPFPRISYTEAVALLRKRGVEVEWGEDFGGDEETVLAKEFETPFLVHRYPAACKAFYMKRDPEDPSLALAMDLLAPEGYGEIIGGGQREDDLGALSRHVAEHGLSGTEWYVDLRRYGSVPHAGFGMGLERAVAWICGLQHVRETIPFPRMLSRLYP